MYSHIRGIACLKTIIIVNNVEYSGHWPVTLLLCIKIDAYVYIPVGKPT